MRIAKGNLKKQSQYLKVQNDVKSVLIMVYGDLGDFGRRKNKANSKPNTGLWPEIRSSNSEIRNELKEYI